MKANFFKIAGVKTEKEFYKLFPDEQSFFKKYPQALKQAQTGYDLNNNQFPDLLEYDNNFDANTPKSEIRGIQDNMGKTALPKKDFMSNATSYIQPAMDIIGGISQLKEDKQEVAQANQKSKMFNVFAQAEKTKKLADIQAAKDNRLKNYVNPTDNIISGNQLFPVYGTGTNVLAKNGSKLKQYQEGGYFDYGAISNSANQLMTGITGKRTRGKGKIGNGIGTAAGTALGGPLGGAIGGFLGEQLGNALDNTQSQINDYNKQTEGYMNSITGHQFANQGLKQFNSFLQNGSQVTNLEQQGELETHWGGEAKPISSNRHLPNGGQTIMFKGNSHGKQDNQGNTGIGVTYGNNSVEVEDNEPATILEDQETGEENLTVFGNLYIPEFALKQINDPKAKGKKFKNYVEMLSLEENKINNTVQKNFELMQDTDDTFAKNSLKLKLEGANLRLKEIAETKEDLAEVQNILNDTATNNGIKASSLAKGKIEIDKLGPETYDASEAKNGARLKQLQDGYGLNIHSGNTQGDYITSSAADYTLEELNNWAKESGFKGKGNKALQEHLYKIPEIKAYVDERHKLYKNSKNPNKNNVFDGMFGQDWIGARNYFKPKSVVTPEIKNSITGNNENLNQDKKNPDPKVTPYKRSKILDAAGMVLPYLRPSNAERFDENQLVGEMYGLTNNQLEPVQAQKYNPQLRDVYDISYQDQLNENNADFRGIQRMAGNNPSALASLAAQKYGANSKVLAEQFRANQQFKEGIYNQNITTLNDAQFKNLNIMDQQYTRQEQAKSNTKEINQALLSSMSAKYQQHKLENQKLKVNENLYNFRYDSQGRAINMNGPSQANVPNVYTDSYINDDAGNPIAIVTKDKDGNAIRTQKIPLTNKPSLAGTNINDDENITTENESKSTYRTGGKIKKYISNGSIIKSFKK